MGQTGTVKPLSFEAHLIRIPVLFEFIVHSLIRNPPNSNLLNWSLGIRIRGVLLYGGLHHSGVGEGVRRGLGGWEGLRCN